MLGGEGSTTLSELDIVKSCDVGAREIEGSRIPTASISCVSAVDSRLIDILAPLIV